MREYPLPPIIKPARINKHLKRYVIAYSWLLGTEIDIVECEAKDTADALLWLIDYLTGEFTDLTDTDKIIEFLINKQYIVSYPYEIVDKS